MTVKQLFLCLRLAKPSRELSWGVERLFFGASFSCPWGR